MQDNLEKPDKAKVIANREMLSTKIQLIKFYDEQILDSIDIETDMEWEIIESSEFDKSVSELIIFINMLRSHNNDEAMSDGTVPYPIQNSNLQNSNNLSLTSIAKTKNSAFFWRCFTISVILGSF